MMAYLRQWCNVPISRIELRSQWEDKEEKRRRDDCLGQALDREVIGI